MLQFVLQKMKCRKWLVVSLLIGNLLLISIAASSPMYTKAALSRMLNNDMKQYVTDNGKYPSVVHLYSSVGSGGLEQFYADRDMINNIDDEFGVESLHVIENLYLDSVALVPQLEREGDSDEKEFRIGYLKDIEDHINIISGELYDDAIAQDGTVKAIVSQKCLVVQNLLVGEILELPTFKFTNGECLKLQITGVYENSDAEDDYWYKGPDSYYRDIMISETAFNKLFMSSATNGSGVRGLWFAVMDYNDFTVDNCENIMNISRNYRETFLNEYSHSYNDYFADIIEVYLQESTRVSVTLRILSVPLYALLAAFVFMVSRQMLDQEQNEISVIKSRGAGKGQIIRIYLIQSLLVAAVCFVVGVPLAMLICQMVGSSNAFLEFVSRQALDVEITGTVLLYAMVAALLSVGAMVLPVFKYADVSIVDHKRTKSVKAKPFWQKLYLDVVLLALSLYGLYSFNGQKDALAQKVAEGAGLDPLLFLCSSLFMIACGLLVFRIIPAVVWLVYNVGKKWWSPSMYSSFLWVQRTKNSQAYIIVFMVVTIAMGVFNAQTARTVNTNEEDRINYMAGADIVIKEVWSDNAQAVQDDPLGMTDLAYTEPDYRKYLELEQADSVTKVLYDESCSVNVTNDMGGNVKVTLMGIDTQEFGNTAWFKDGLLPTHVNNYLNAISQTPNAILVSANFHELYGYELGDVINYKNSAGDFARGVIYGFVDYFPTYNSVVQVEGKDGLLTEENRFLIVSNYDYLRSRWGVRPYEVWIKTAEDTDFIYDFVVENDLELTKFVDAKAQLIQLKNDPIFQGTNGILTVSFVVTLLICSVGFLIYWILSINSRSLQFGIFRAMGMTMKEVIVMLVNEQVWISGLSILFGVVIGVIASRLYIPLVQLAYAATDTVIPLHIVSETSDMVRLLAVVALVIAVCMVVLGTLISKMKISQALKLGED